MAKKLNLRRAKQFRPLSVTPGVEVSPLVTRALTPGGGASPAAALKVRCVPASGATRGVKGVKLTPPKYLEGPALALEGPLWLFEWPALPFEGPALALEGLALALEGPALALEGPALALEGPALALEGPALALEGPALALQGPLWPKWGPLWPWRVRTGFEGVRSCFVGTALAF